MSTPLKWLVVFLTGLFVVFIVAYNLTVQESAVRTTGEVETLAESMKVGLIRSEIEDGNDGFSFVSKEEVVTNLVSHVATVQKTHPYSINLQYVFLDESGNVTEEEKDIRSLQFVVQYLDEAGEVKATAEKHLKLNILQE